ncbi:ATP-dependent nuclease subunit B [Meiothermus cerbereus]|uniref:ATP-dependent nuclease subunit B n=1 Tax=Meiothermus cerbereus TaxID=65552 RepID=UPI003EEC3556
MHLIVGPPASGKTTCLLEVAQAYLRQRKRVWWVCLPAQKAYVYRRATEQGATLGLEVLSSQQLYYRLLAASFGLKPILTGPGRVALVGEALLSDDSPLPSPGEARLFSRAIAEAKRNGVGPEEIPILGPETRRLQVVYARYEELKQIWGRWDYDDFRAGALELLEQGRAQLEPDLVVVDGFRELSVQELRLLLALSRYVPLWVSLPEAPPGFAAHQELSHRPIPTQVYRAQNPVSEARWVLRAIKRDLAQGMKPLEVAVVAPESRIPALLTLADEYGLPLIEHLPRTAADTPEGRLLLELLELPDYPTPTRLLAVPDLAPLGRAALERGLVGFEAISRLAAELGMQAVWAAWLSRLRSPGEEGSVFENHQPTLHPSLAWAEELLDSLPEVRHSPRRASLMERALEAHRIGSGPDFRHWWAALLAETYEPHRPPGGVAVLTPNLASGQRWKKLYLTYAVEGAYSSGEQEDYFIPEEWRVSLEEALGRAGGSLPRRFMGRDRLLLHELKTRADEVIVTYPEASQEGPLEPEPILVGPHPPYLPELPPASPLELAQNGGYKAPLGQVNLGSPRVENLRHYHECGFQFWAQQLTPVEEEPLWWQQWVRELRKAEKLVPARLEALARQFPQTEGWMRQHYSLLGELNLGFKLEGRGLEARLDGVLRKGGEVHIYRFVAPETRPEDAEQQVRNRWSERWAAAHLLAAYPGRVQRVYLWAWPVLGKPVLLYGKPIEKLWNTLKALLDRAQATYTQYKAGVVEPNPGFRCRSCNVKDVCREGRLG